MADQRAAIPVPADELSRARAELAPRYGSTVVDEEDKRILIIRVPHAQPDPVNDVELAVDFLQPGDVEEITHCLLIGDQAIAQVYARPLQDLMQERIREDREISALLRQRLAPGLSHELFQAPTDPRRRWRLGVRLPIQSIAELGEQVLDDVTDVLGPQLDTPRFKSLCAVYLLTETDDVRLEPDLFTQDIRNQWEDEDRKRRQELARVQAAEQARREQEEERQRIRDEMDRRLGVRGAPSLGRRTSWRERSELDDVPGLIDRAADHTVPAEPPLDLHELDAPDRLRDTRAPVIEAESTIVARPPPAVPGGPWAASTDSVEAPDGIDTIDRPTPSAPDVDAARAAIRDLDAVTQAPPPTPARTPIVEEPAEEADLDDHIEGLRRRVERVLDEPSDWRARRAARQRSRTTDLPPRRRVPMPDPRPGETPWRDTDRDRRAPMPDPRPSDMPWRDSDRDRSWSVEARGDLARRLEAAGFDVLYDPPAGLGIDLAAERPDGHPQRMVIRCAPSLDTETARGLLKTARELDVDVVLCVCEKIIPEAERLLVATKVRAVRADAIDKLPF